MSVCQKRFIVGGEEGEISLAGSNTEKASPSSTSSSSKEESVRSHWLRLERYRETRSETVFSGSESEFVVPPIDSEVSPNEETSGKLSRGHRTSQRNQKRDGQSLRRQRRRWHWLAAGAVVTCASTIESNWRGELFLPGADARPLQVLANTRQARFYDEVFEYLAKLAETPCDIILHGVQPWLVGLQNEAAHWADLDFSDQLKIVKALHQNGGQLLAAIGGKDYALTYLYFEPLDFALAVCELYAPAMSIDGLIVDLQAELNITGGLKGWLEWYLEWANICENELNVSVSLSIKPDYVRQLMELQTLPFTYEASEASWMPDPASEDKRGRGQLSSQSPSSPALASSTARLPRLSATSPYNVRLTVDQHTSTLPPAFSSTANWDSSHRRRIGEIRQPEAATSYGSEEAGDASGQNGLQPSDRLMGRHGLGFEHSAGLTRAIIARYGYSGGGGWKSRGEPKFSPADANTSGSSYTRTRNSTVSFPLRPDAPGSQEDFLDTNDIFYPGDLPFFTRHSSASTNNRRPTLQAFRQIPDHWVRLPPPGSNLLPIRATDENAARDMMARSVGEVERPLTVGYPISESEANFSKPNSDDIEVRLFPGENFKPTFIEPRRWSAAVHPGDLPAGLGLVIINWQAEPLRPMNYTMVVEGSHPIKYDWIQLRALADQAVWIQGGRLTLRLWVPLTWGPGSGEPLDGNKGMNTSAGFVSGVDRSRWPSPQTLETWLERLSTSEIGKQTASQGGLTLGTSPSVSGQWSTIIELCRRWIPRFDYLVNGGTS